MVISRVRVLHHLTSLEVLLEKHITIRRQIAHSGSTAVQQHEILHRKYMYNVINTCLYYNLYNCLCHSCFMTYLIADQYILFGVDQIRRDKHKAYLFKPYPIN